MDKIERKIEEVRRFAAAIVSQIQDYDCEEKTEKALSELLLGIDSDLDELQTLKEAHFHLRWWLMKNAQMQVEIAKSRSTGAPDVPRNETYTASTPQ